MTSTTADLLEGLETFFDEGRIGFDLREGVLWNPAKTRLCLLSNDFLTGVYNAVKDEAGPAWPVIFKTCGRIWGERIMRRLEREAQVVGNLQIRELPVSMFLRFFREYFVYHGWGLMTIDVSRARETGIVTAALEDSIFAEVIRDEDEFSDPMIAGILAGMLSYMSGQDLDGVQTECISRGAEASRFVVTGAARLRGISEKIKSGMTHEQVVETV
jgi:predicted hydrocarbon binding protein